MKISGQVTSMEKNAGRYIVGVCMNDNGSRYFTWKIFYDYSKREVIERLRTENISVSHDYY